ncbi:redoxin domain-containing protein [candidate division KSB3 bacterium]|uniref:Redoxin domain-containing protein n=1 Tax=candidate division KSB3 bacterium TaxID=2044937 RepID=A0A9D5JZE3_9BACT|nr:redoxin domain-containing protein [candidate division KSB3 bacterium]MBD3327034.1 redoxin domain-containing protein [candidate division KSB3 bacterium]
MTLAQTDDSSPPQKSFAGTVPAPEFPTGLDWLNTDRPLSLADLRGKVVILDFWTYGCINCLHVIPQLKRLEEKYAEELVVIGVHSAKFENEKDTENIRRIILRYELEHPVINDKDFLVWSQYGIRAWPTLILIDPDGKVIGGQPGEEIYELFDTVIGNVVAEFDAKGRIDRTPLDLILEKENLVDRPLLFPGKVLADEARQRIFIADSNHNRLVITDLEGKVLEVIGNGQAALTDGDYQTASFFRPQGLTLADPDTLYVADTQNHAIRKVNLAAETVETVAGTGEQVYMTTPQGSAESTALNSPWDLLYHDGRVYIAMAGQHQLWVYDPAAQTISLYAGSGREELKDGALSEGGLNQPSGLATDESVLFVADSEASAVRTASLDPAGTLHTIVGTGLFDFGDVDGTGDEVRLQHPLGVAYHDGKLYVADTYNSKIKLIDPEARTSQTFLGGDDAGWRDGMDALFDEPGGVSIGEKTLYIADTNNHVIRLADLQTKKVKTLVLNDQEGLLTQQPIANIADLKIVTLAPQTVGVGDGIVRLDVTLPPGHQLTDFAPFSMTWSSQNASLRIEPDVAKQRIVTPAFPLEVPVTLTEGETVLSGDLVIYYCTVEATKLCLIDQVQLQIPVTVTPEADSTIRVPYTIQ